jgi:formyl-CoA transferase
MIGAGNDAQWQRLSNLLELAILTENPRFATNVTRVANLAETARPVEERIAPRPVAPWLDALSAAGVPCAAIQPLDRALVHPQLASRRLVLETDHPVLGQMPQTEFPIAFNRAPCSGQRPPPLHGQHTTGVLCALGDGNAAIAALAAQGAIHTLSEAEVPA